MSDLAWLTAAEASTLLRAKKLSPVEYAKALIERIERYDKKLNAFLRFTPDRKAGMVAGIPMKRAGRAEDGGDKAFDRSWSNGSYGASNGAHTVNARNTTAIARPKRIA